MSALLSVDALLGLATPTLMEIVLGIDNVVFIAILVAKLPAGQQASPAGWASSWLSASASSSS